VVGLFIFYNLQPFFSLLCFFLDLLCHLNVILFVFVLLFAVLGCNWTCLAVVKRMNK
jgi:hypothetical protein